MADISEDASGAPQAWRQSPPPTPDAVGDRTSAAAMRSAALNALWYAIASWRRLALGSVLTVVPASAVMVELWRQDAAGRPNGYAVATNASGLVAQLVLGCVAVGAAVALVLHARRGRHLRQLFEAWDRFGFDPSARALPRLPAPTPSPPQRRGRFSWWRDPKPVQFQTVLPAPEPGYRRMLDDVWLGGRLLAHFLVSVVLGVFGLAIGVGLLAFSVLADDNDAVMTAAMAAAGAVPVVAAVGAFVTARREALASSALERRSDVADFVGKARQDLGSDRTSPPEQLAQEEQSVVQRNFMIVIPFAVVALLGLAFELRGEPWGVWVSVIAPFAAPVPVWFAWSRWRRYRLPAQAVRRGLLASDSPAVLARSVRDDSRDHRRPQAVASVDVPADVLDAVQARTYVVQAGADSLMLVDGKRRIILDTRLLLGAALVPGARVSRLDVVLLWPKGETLILSTLQRKALISILHAAGVPFAPLHVEGFEALLSRQRETARLVARQ